MQREVAGQAERRTELDLVLRILVFRSFLRVQAHVQPGVACGDLPGLEWLPLRTNFHTIGFAGVVKASLQRDEQMGRSRIGGEFRCAWAISDEMVVLVVEPGDIKREQVWLDMSAILQQLPQD